MLVHLQVSWIPVACKTTCLLHMHYHRIDSSEGTVAPLLLPVVHAVHVRCGCSTWTTTAALQHNHGMASSRALLWSTSDSLAAITMILVVKPFPVRLHSQSHPHSFEEPQSKNTLSQNSSGNWPESPLRPLTLIPMNISLETSNPSWDGMLSVIKGKSARLRPVCFANEPNSLGMEPVNKFWDK